MKRLLSLSSLIIICSLTIIISAQDAKENQVKTKQPSATEIFGKYAEAIGGKQALEKVKSRVVKGTAEISAMNLKGTFETVAAAPNKNLVVLNLSGFGESVNGFDGSVGWASNAIEGLRTKSGEELEQAKLTSDFYSVLNLSKNYPQAAVTGTSKIGAAEVYVVKANPDTTFYFDKQTGLLLRTDRIMFGAEGKMPVQTLFEDFREVDGIKQPFTIRQSLHGGELLMKATEIKHNVEIDPARFSKPK